MVGQDNMKKIKTYFFILVLFCFNAISQNDKKVFCDKFFKADLKTRVRLVSSLSPEKLSEIYPLISDTLEKVKKQLYFKSQSKEPKFLIDIIEVNLEIGKKNYAKSIFLSENCLQNNASNVNDSLRCYSNLKASFINIRNFIKAYEIHSKMEAIWHRKNDTLKIDLGMKKSGLYASLSFYDEAIKERRREFYSGYKAGDKDALASFYNDIGVYFNRLRNSDSAEVCFLKAKEVLNSMQYPAERKGHYDFFKALVGGNLGLCYYNKGLIANAIPLLKQDIYYSLKDNDYGSAFNSYNLMVECMIKTNNKPLAKLYLDSAENLITLKLSDVTQSVKFLLLKSNYYQSAGDLNKSTTYLNQYFHLKDSLSVHEKELSVLNTEIAFKIEQKEFELSEKNKMLEQKTLEDARNKTSKAYLLTGILLLLGVVVFLILINYFSKKREKDLYVKNEQIIKQSNQIEQSLKEKEILIREIHHRVKNNLQIITSMLSLQISKEEGKEAESILRETKQRISSIALTHQMLYQNSNLSEIEITKYIENLVRQIELSFPPSNIKLITELYSNGRRISIDNAVPLGLLINELLTNSFKHAFPNNTKGTIKITLKENDKDCEITITDDGIGLPKNFKTAENKSMGMDLIFILAEQIDAELKIEDKNGSSFSLKIPIKKLYI